MITKKTIHSGHLSYRRGDERRARTVSGRLGYSECHRFCEVSRDLGVPESVLVRLALVRLINDPGQVDSLRAFLAAPPPETQA